MSTDREIVSRKCTISLSIFFIQSSLSFLIRITSPSSTCVYASFGAKKIAIGSSILMMIIMLLISSLVKLPPELIFLYNVDSSIPSFSANSLIVIPINTSCALNRFLSNKINHLPFLRFRKSKIAHFAHVVNAFLQVFLIFFIIALHFCKFRYIMNSYS